MELDMRRQSRRASSLAAKEAATVFTTEQSLRDGGVMHGDGENAKHRDKEGQIGAHKSDVSCMRRDAPDGNVGARIDVEHICREVSQSDLKEEGHLQFVAHARAVWF